jgi:hypothetical protein
MKLVLFKSGEPAVLSLFNTPEDVTSWLERALVDEGYTLRHVDYTYSIENGEELHRMAVFVEDEMRKRHALEGFYLKGLREYYGRNIRPSIDLKPLIKKSK